MQILEDRSSQAYSDEDCLLNRHICQGVRRKHLRNRKPVNTNKGTRQVNPNTSLAFFILSILTEKNP